MLQEQNLDNLPFNPSHKLKQMAQLHKVDAYSALFAKILDDSDELKHFRDEFCYPKMKHLPDVDTTLVNPEADSIYLCGNSLGLKPKSAENYVRREMDKWAETGVLGHFNGEMPWSRCDEHAVEGHARLVGAKPEEIAVMNGLTVNIHLMLVSFYRPTPQRHKILLESKAFPSDHFAIESQMRFHGYDPKDSMIMLQPRKDESSLRTEDILKCIEEHGDEIALVFFSGVQYYTGQLFEIERITSAGHKKGCLVGWDMAHAAGNVPLRLHDWDIDFAVWCSYKYLNSGCGNLGIVFLHEKHAKNDFPKFSGWWSDEVQHRMKMTNELHLTPGASGYRLSNPPMLLLCPMLASLDIFRKTSMTQLRNKSLLLTGYLEHLLDFYMGENSPNLSTTCYYRLVTPRDPRQRGCQLSLYFSKNLSGVLKELQKRGVVCDKRLPNVLRVTPVHLYNNFSDVYRFVKTLVECCVIVFGSDQN